MRGNTKGIFRLFSVILVLILGFSLSACSAAKEPLKIEDGICTVPNENVSFSVPENSVVFSQASSAFSNDWALANIDDPTSKIKEYEQTNTIANVVSIGGENSIYVMKKQTAETIDIYNLTMGGDSAMEKAMSDLEEINETEDYAGVFTPVMVGDIQYIRNEITYEPENNPGGARYEISYMTIINGESYMFDINSVGLSIEKSKTDYLDEFVKGVEFAQILEKSDESLPAKQVFIMLLPIILIVLIIVSFILYVHFKKKRINKEKDELTEKLAEYRKRQRAERENPDIQTEKRTLFVNKTVHTDELLHQFSYFHSYKRFIMFIPVYALTCIVTAAMGIYLLMQADYIWALIMVAAAVYCAVKVITTPGNAYKVLQRVYGKLPNRVALYMFREDDFRLSGLQATGEFAYFQIIEAYETKDMFYIYLNEENAYFIDKNNFSFGTAEDFRALLKEKLGKKFKRRMF